MKTDNGINIKLNLTHVRELENKIMRQERYVGMLCKLSMLLMIPLIICIGLNVDKKIKNYAILGIAMLVLICMLFLEYQITKNNFRSANLLVKELQGILMGNYSIFSIEIKSKYLVIVYYADNKLLKELKIKLVRVWDKDYIEIRDICKKNKYSLFACVPEVKKK